MKNLLGLLGATSLVATTSATVVACGTKSENDKLTIEQKIEKFNNFSKENDRKQMSMENQELIINTIDNAVLGYEILQEKPDAELLESLISKNSINSKDNFVNFLIFMKNGLKERMTENTENYINQLISKYSK